MDHSRYTPFREGDARMSQSAYLNDFGTDFCPTKPPY